MSFNDQNNEEGGEGAIQLICGHMAVSFIN